MTLQLRIEELINNSKHLFKNETGTVCYLVKEIDKLFEMYKK